MWINFGVCLMALLECFSSYACKQLIKYPVSWLLFAVTKENGSDLRTVKASFWHFQSCLLHLSLSWHVSYLLPVFLKAWSRNNFMSITLECLFKAGNSQAPSQIQRIRICAEEPGNFHFKTKSAGNFLHAWIWEPLFLVLSKVLLISWQPLGISSTT